MAIIHVPRTIASIVRGYIHHHRQVKSPKTGFHFSLPHLYKARVGLFDVDYLGHMNNAAYLSHAEYARWEMIASNGVLMKMFKSKTHFMVASTAVRYRREIRPLYRKFTVESHVAGLDRRNIWIMHNFRVFGLGTGKKKEARIRAQLVVQGVAVKDRHIVDPREFFMNEVGIDHNIIHELDLERTTANTDTRNSDLSMQIMEQYNALDYLLKHEAAKDDDLHVD